MFQQVISMVRSTHSSGVILFIDAQNKYYISTNACVIFDLPFVG